MTAVSMTKEKYELRRHSSQCVIQYVYDVIDTKRILNKHIVLLPYEKPHTCILWLDVKFVMLFQLQ